MSIERMFRMLSSYSAATIAYLLQACLKSAYPIHPACETLSHAVVLVVVAQDVVVYGGRDCHLRHVRLVGSSRHAQRPAVAEAYLCHLADSARSLDDAHIKSPTSVHPRCLVPTYFAKSFSENLMVYFDEGYL